MQETEKVSMSSKTMEELEATESKAFGHLTDVNPMMAKH